jgi:hypothetical protein
MAFAWTGLGKKGEILPTGWPTFQPSCEIMTSQKKKKVF